MSSINRSSARDLSAADDRTYLVETVVSLIDRTFFESGHGEGMRLVRDALLRMDPPALRGVLRSMGVEAAEEASESSSDEGVPPRP